MLSLLLKHHLASYSAKINDFPEVNNINCSILI